MVLLLAALLAPAIEAFDSWDSTPGLAGDTEFHVAAMAIAAGLIAAVLVVAARIRVRLTDLPSEDQPMSARSYRSAPPLAFSSGSSPPLVPLRI
jgi:hypothetical protein